MSTPEPTTWSVTTVQQYTEFQPGGSTQEGYRVHFRTANGAEGYQFVPDSLIQNGPQVNQLVHDKAVVLDGLLRMTNH